MIWLTNILNRRLTESATSAASANMQLERFPQQAALPPVNPTQPGPAVQTFPDPSFLATQNADFLIAEAKKLMRLTPSARANVPNHYRLELLARLRRAEREIGGFLRR